MTDPYLKNKKVKLFFKEDIEPHEVLLDNLAKEREKETGISEKKLEVPLLKKALLRFFYFSGLIISLLFLKTLQLQVIEGKDFLRQAEENKYIVHKIQAERGVIYDSNLKQLVFNRFSYDLIADKSNLPENVGERENVLKEISQVLKIDKAVLESKIEESQDSLIEISQDIDYQTLIVLETKIDQLPGFEIKENLVREYQDGETFSHLIGYMGKIKSEEIRDDPDFYSILDNIGREGIEKSYEKTLRRDPGKIKIERDAKGNIISKEVSALPESGKNLVLWLDSDLQKKAEEELEKELAILGAKKGAVIAMDPKTGGILSMVSLPSFDNNAFAKRDQEKIEEILEDPQNPLFNRAVSGQYPSGSTIKPLIASAALEEKIISPEKKILDQGFIEVPHRYDPTIVYKFLDWKVHGWVDLRKAIAESCNVYFYTVGGGYGSQPGLGPTRIKKYLELFGWGNPTNIDLPAESQGLIPSPEWKQAVKKEGWWDGDTYHLSIGQGDLLVTPLQVVNSFAAIANGGTLLTPSLVQEIIDDQKNVVQKMYPQIIRDNFISGDNLQIVREGMRQAVTSPEGSSHILSSLPVSSAAKTGTAETGKENYYHNWVTVFAPYDNPKIVLTVMIENVQGMQAAALPVARTILDWYFGPR